jgi:acetate kinase
MKLAQPSVLTINGGSSSIRFALYEQGEPLRRLRDGKMDRVGLAGTHLTFKDSTGKPQAGRTIDTGSHRSAVVFLLDWLETQQGFASVKAVGHRVVHGMPRIAKLMPIPRRYAAKGIERYGFHGLSYAYLMEELGRLDPAAAKGRVILAHLGNGASLAAVRDGKSIDTSMGFTPTAGLLMSTRTGDLDPSLAYFLARTEQMSAARFQTMVNHESGLLGVSGTSSDLRDLLARESDDVRAAEAVALFCYQVKKWIGSFTAALGGLDTLVFAGGIGENAPLIRARICEGLGFLGIELNEASNTENASLISTDGGRVAVRVIRTDEELMIARSVIRVLGLGAQKVS